MSAQLALDAMRQFLSTDVPEVLCIRGGWGVGKTFSWNRLLSDARAENILKLPRYSYASLFGLSRIEDIHRAILAGLEGGAEDEHLTELGKFLKKHSVNAGTKIASLLKFGSIPYIGNISGLLDAFLPQFLSNTLICIDDIERKNKEMTFNLLMGTVSILKERHGCKIVLLMNSEKFDNEEAKEYERYVEKVVDATLTFAPTSEEALAISLAPDESRTTPWLVENCIDLNIRNIRIIKKIEKIGLLLDQYLIDTHIDTAKSIFRSFCFIAWAVYDKEFAPNIDYVKSKYSIPGIDKKELTPSEVKWEKISNSYGFRYFNELDSEMLVGIQHGWFDGGKLASLITEQSLSDGRSRAQTDLRDLFDRVFQTFDHDNADLSSYVYDKSLELVSALNSSYLQLIVKILKASERGDLALMLITRYVSAHRDNISRFSTQDRFDGPINDPDIISAFSPILATAVLQLPTAAEAAMKIGGQRGWDEKDEQVLAQMSVEDFVRLFKSEHGERLENIMLGVSLFKKLAGATDQQKSIAQAAKAALEKIGGESDLNRLRADAYLSR